jgi:hypothetical protein
MKPCFWLRRFRWSVYFRARHSIGSLRERARKPCARLHHRQIFPEYWRKPAGGWHWACLCGKCGGVDAKFGEIGD